MIDDMEKDNTPIYTVSELSVSLKQTIETNYSNVKIRGEFGRITRAQSGHVYLDMKDEKAVLSAIIWKGIASKLQHKPEEGMEVIATGRLTIFQGRSQYQFIIEHFELAGIGALMKLLEERKKKLAELGFFNPEHKQKLPFCPSVIGVITSPTGAVIRDIIHRISDRFPAQILLWSVPVQGNEASKAITEAINGFNQFPKTLPHPELILIARGGGSLEDLWAFNEENIVRAVFKSHIPIISAIGHETDWTLIDLVADYRAPTPTGAAEIAVPVRLEMLAQTNDLGTRIKKALLRNLKQNHTELHSIKARFSKPDRFLSFHRQSFDRLSERFKMSLLTYLQIQQQKFQIAQKGLSSRLLQNTLNYQKQQIENYKTRLEESIKRYLSKLNLSFDTNAKLLEAISHKAVLKRGYVIAKKMTTETNHQLIRRSKRLKEKDKISLLFYDGERLAEILAPSSKKTTERSKKNKDQETPSIQGKLF